MTSILGQATAVTREGPQLLFAVRFDTTPEGEAAWQRVQSGSLRTVSVGYAVHEFEEVRVGQTNTRGAEPVEGPAVIVTDWELFELSMVPVPADAEAVKRSFYGDQMNLSTIMDKRAEESEGEAPEGTSGDEARKLIAQAIEAGITVEQVAAAIGSEATHGLLAGEREEASDEMLAALAALLAEDEESEGEAPAAEDEESEGEESEDEERGAHTIKFPAYADAARRDAIRDMAPRGLEAYADQLALEVDERGQALDLEMIRLRLLERHAERHAPVGTPAPRPPARQNDTTTEQTAPDGEAAERSALLNTLTGRRA